MEKIIEIKNLKKRYNEFSLKNIDLEIKENGIVGFIGVNGSGKTTLINCLMNFIDYDCDYYLYKSKSVKMSSYKYKCSIGYMGDTISMFPSATVKQIIEFYSRVYKDDWSQQQFQSHFKQFELSHHKKIKDLSTGMKTKLFLLLILSRTPEILILDEPTSGLDPIIRNEIISMLKTYQKDNNGTIFFSSHITEDIELLANRIIYIDNGSILLDIKKEDIKKRFKKIDLNKNSRFEIIENVVMNDIWAIIDLNDIKEYLIKDIVLEDCSVLDVYIYLRRCKNV